MHYGKMLAAFMVATMSLSLAPVASASHEPCDPDDTLALPCRPSVAP